MQNSYSTASQSPDSVNVNIFIPKKPFRNLVQQNFVNRPNENKPIEAFFTQIYIHIIFKKSEIQTVNFLRTYLDHGNLLQNECKYQ